MTLLGSTVAASSGTFIAGMLIPSINSKGIIAGYCFTLFPGACALIGLFVIPRKTFKCIKNRLSDTNKVSIRKLLEDIHPFIRLLRGIPAYAKSNHLLISHMIWF